MDSKIIAVATFLATYLLVADAVIGINWGRQSAQKLLPSNVLDLMLQNGIREARVFTTEEELLRAFAGSGIGLTLTISNVPNYQTIPQAKSWILPKKKYFLPSNVRRVYVADYVFGLFFNKQLINDAIECMQSTQTVLNDEGYGDQIKVTIPHNKFVLKWNNTTLRPSEVEFLDEIKPEMTSFLRWLQQNNAPFVFAVNTISDILDAGVDYNFAFVDNKSDVVINDINGAVYTNMFEIAYDSFIWALTKLNASDLKVIVSMVGWPTDGCFGADVTTAERYYKSLLPFVSSNKGTPVRPGAPIDVYIHSLTDENKMPVFGTTSFTRHMGIYLSNGKPKYKIDMSGRGRDILPAESKGIMRMPDRWCMFNEHGSNISNITKVNNQVAKACSWADCTTMAPGGSCSRLGYPLNVSYAFNMHFQFQYQNESECDFEGLGYVSTVDPSMPACIFPVGVVRPEPLSVGKRLQESPNSAVFITLFSILGALIWS